MALNTVCLVGRITYAPELKSTSSGVSVIRFQLAVDRTYQPKGQERQADFIDCVAWRQTAEFISRNFQKGQMIAVEGSIQTENYTDKDGKQRKSVEVIANNVSFCGSKENGAQSVTGDNTADYEEIVDDTEDWICLSKTGWLSSSYVI